MMSISSDQALQSLTREFEAKRAEILRTQAEQKAKIEQAAHLESTRQAAASAQAARQAEIDSFEELFVIPTQAEFEGIENSAKVLNAQIESLVEQLVALVPRQKMLAEQLVAWSHNAGKRARTLGLRPLRHGGSEFDEKARTFWVRLFFASAVWNQPVPAVGFGFAASGTKFPLAERLVMMPDQTTLPAPAVVPAPTTPQTSNTKVKASPEVKRTSYPVEIWAGEHATIGVGSTAASVAYDHYQECCESLGVPSVTTNEFAAELADLFVEKKRSNRGVFYGLTLKS